MESPPQFLVTLYLALIVCIGPALLVAGVLAYFGHWKSWVGPSGPFSTAKHSRSAFIMFWIGVPMTVMDLLLGLEAIGVDASVTTDLVLAPVVLCMPITGMHVYFLPKALRPLLLPRWYRDWEAAQFEVEEREAERRRARRARRREKRRKMKEQASF